MTRPDWCPPDVWTRLGAFDWFKPVQPKATPPCPAWCPSDIWLQVDRTPVKRVAAARNGFQVLGPDLNSPSDFVVCWTKDGKASGGTGQALRIALYNGIPIFNLHDATAEARLRAAVTAIRGA